MKNFKKIGALLFLSAYLVIGLSLSIPVFAAEEVKFSPQISIPGTEFQTGTGVAVGETVGATTSSTLLARYIKSFYTWGLSIVGVLAVLMLMAGGITWLTSAGDSGKIGNAKKMISGSLFGTLLLVGAYFFLNTINPDLTKLPALEMANIKPLGGLDCCDPDKGIISYPVTIVNGKKMAANGENKIISCKASSPECKANEKCSDVHRTGKYQCFDNKSCSTEPGAGCYASCPANYGEDLQLADFKCADSQKCCYPINRGLNASCGGPFSKSVCLTAINDDCPNGSVFNVLGKTHDDKQECASGLKCCIKQGKQLGETCSDDAGSKCATGCSAGYSSTFTNNCGSGLYCCYPNGDKKEGDSCGTKPGAKCTKGYDLLVGCSGTLTWDSSGSSCPIGLGCCY